VPDSLIWPFSITTPWLASRRPDRAFCSTSKIVVPAPFIAMMASNTVLSTLGASPIDGSSSSSSAGSSMSARPNSTSRCCPPDRLPAFCDRHRAICGNASKTASIRLATVARSPRMYPPSSMFSHTVMSRNRLWFCGTCTTPSRSTSRGDLPASGSPLSVIVPSLGLSSPLTHRISVDFPAPLGPTTHVIPPAGTSRHTPRSTSPPP
jgi:hypothetical protein